jgi:hypothetical protein
MEGGEVVVDGSHMRRFVRDRQHMPHTVISIAVGLLVTACGAGGGTRTTVNLPEGTPIAIDSTPAVSIGVVEGDTLRALDHVVTPFVLTDGRVVIPLGSARVIRVFEPDGRYVTTFGGPGEGPGELEWVGAAWPRGDTVEVFDWRLQRITKFHPDGTSDVVPLRAVPAAQSAVPGADAAGWFAYGVVKVGGDGRDQMVVHRVQPDGRDGGEVAKVLGMSRYSFPGGTGPEPLSPRAFLATHGGRLYLAESPIPVVRVVDPSTEEEDTITWEAPPAQSAGAVLAAVIDSAVARAPVERRKSLRASLESSPDPHLSVLWGLIVDADGFIWIRDHNPLVNAAALGGLGGPGPGGVWTVLSPSGNKVGSIRMPGELEPSQITESQVVGVRRDDLGVESVQVYPLIRR